MRLNDFATAERARSFAGASIGVAINGMPLASVRDRTYLDGLIMPEAFTQNGPMEARFGNLTITAH